MNGLLNDAAVLDREGFNAIPLGSNYDPDDFADMTHISNSGAPKMAEEVAARLRAMIGRDGDKTGKE